MWTPNAEQAARIDALGRAMHSRIDALWQTTLERDRDWIAAPAWSRPDIAALREETIRQVSEEFPRDHAAWGDFLCFPLLRAPESNYDHPQYHHHLLAQILTTTVVRETPTPYAAAVLSKRLEHMLRHVFDQTELIPWRWTGYANAYRYPDVEHGLRLLAEIAYDVDAAAATVRAIVDGEWDSPVTPPALPDGRRDQTNGQYFDEIQRSYQAYANEIASFCVDAFVPLHRIGNLTYERFAAIVERFPRAFPRGRMFRDHSHGDTRTGPAASAQDEAAVREFTRRLAWETAQTLDDRAVALLNEWCYGGWEGARWLIRACEHIEHIALPVILSSSYQGSERLCRQLAEIGKTDNDAEDREAAVAKLRAFKPATLQMVLPFARGGQSLVLDALGWSSAKPLIELIHGLGQRWPDRHGMRSGGIDLENSPNPESGVVDREEIVAALEAAGDKTARAILEVYRRAKADFTNTLTLIEAVGGWNAKDLLGRAQRQSQIALKSLGLLAITRGDDEVRERYVVLKEAGRNAKKFGPERQANIKAAVEAGLQNLAVHAGFGDPWRLERRMEAQLGDAGPPIGVPTAIDQWHVELTVDDGQPALIVRRGARALASVPAKLRREPDYLALKARVDELRAQATRVRQSLERALVEEDVFSRDEFLDTASLASARGQAAALVWRTPDGCGLFERDTQTLRALDGRALSLQDGVTVAHPYHLFADGVLADWQREIVRRRIRQPFKQVFRELYVLTPAERAARLASPRFAHHTLTGKIVSRLAQARGWLVPPHHDAFPMKVFRRAGVRAQFVFFEAGPFLGAAETLRTGAISFARRVHVDAWLGVDETQCVPLEEILPIVFSEVMRDADLFVSVAHHEGEAPFSEEVCAHRRELVRVLASDLGLPNVTVDGHFAHIAGERARYRVHLGSGSAFIEPGGHLCIVPEGSRTSADLYLPFADPDANTSLTISKILLLANDTLVTDPVILAQIDRALSERPATV